MCFLERHVSDLPPQGNFDVCEGDRGGSCRFQSSSRPLSFSSGFWLARSHWAAPERLHPGGRARPLLITYERTESRTNEIYGGRYGPEARGEAAEDTTASSHTSRDENPDSRRPRFEGARSGFQGYSSKLQRNVHSGTEHICGEASGTPTHRSGSRI